MTIQWRIQDFPAGGHRTIGGDYRPPTRVLFGKTYVKMKELDPAGGGGRPLDPPMQNEVFSHFAYDTLRRFSALTYLPVELIYP